MKAFTFLAISLLAVLGVASPTADRSSELTLEPRQCLVNGLFCGSASECCSGNCITVLCQNAPEGPRCQPEGKSCI
ncbi:hypothetical protein GTA08_BOTSDO05910 [Botryosphaeria dothidea]|uniref:Uncharacterized protein n=1 Tax=Botryosphaeria dothidea TaxID=55169 RepID=A0A8H4IUP4_9PEZI|nr:hypothetical protein GTA08_BOTSDO05910 [Botryosphaeria dothidea]